MSSDAFEPVLTLAAGTAVSYLIYAVTDALIPRLGPDFVAKRLCGYDQLKGHGLPGRPAKVAMCVHLQQSHQNQGWANPTKHLR